MHRSLLTRSTVTDLLANARQQKEDLQEVPPLMILLTTSGELLLPPLAELPAEAPAKRALFYRIGKAVPNVAEAVLVSEAWVAPPGSTVAPSQHPNRQEAITVTGRNRNNTNGVFAKQIFTTKDNHIIWQAPDIIIKPRSSEGLVDLIFAP